MKIAAFEIRGLNIFSQISHWNQDLHSDGVETGSKSNAIGHKDTFFDTNGFFVSGNGVN